MQIRLLCFGRLREIIAAEQRLDLPEGTTVAALWQQLRAQHPALAPYEGAVAVAINQNFASAESLLHEGDEVALLPPVSGGSPEAPLSTAHARLQWEPIDSAAVQEQIKAPEDGALCVFDGIVRNHTRNRRTLYLVYEGYSAMAVAEMERLANEALSRFAVRDLRIVHRLGRLEIGETSVLIAVASAHRAAAFDACRWLIDQLKQRVPVWKKEFFEDGAVWADGEAFPPDFVL
jgi:molybdopterin synthase catalytic subunit